MQWTGFLRPPAALASGDAKSLSKKYHQSTMSTLYLSCCRCLFDDYNYERWIRHPCINVVRSVYRCTTPYPTVHVVTHGPQLQQPRNKRILVVFSKMRRALLKVRRFVVHVPSISHEGTSKFCGRDSIKILNVVELQKILKAKAEFNRKNLQNVQKEAELQKILYRNQSSVGKNLQRAVSRYWSSE